MHQAIINGLPVVRRFASDYNRPYAGKTTPTSELDVIRVKDKQFHCNMATCCLLA